MNKATVFIVSSLEGVEFARAVRFSLAHDAEVTRLLSSHAIGPKRKMPGGLGVESLRTPASWRSPGSMRISCGSSSVGPQMSN
jgi:hypothetical protein